MAVSSAASSGPQQKQMSLPGVLAGVAGALVGFYISRSMGPTIGPRLLGGAMMGLLVGMLPYTLAKRADDPALARRSLIWTCLAGAVLGIIAALPVALVWSFVVMRRTRAVA